MRFLEGENRSSSFYVMLDFLQFECGEELQSNCGSISSSFHHHLFFLSTSETSTFLGHEFL
jgi:hypothetical protein